MNSKKSLLIIYKFGIKSMVRKKWMGNYLIILCIILMLMLVLKVL